MDYIDFVNALFDNQKWSSVSDADKKKNLFLFLRLISIKFPELAHAFNKNKINEAQTVDYLRNLLVSRYSSKPQWIFTKRESAVKDVNWEKLKKFDNKYVIMYINKNELSSIDFTFKMDNYPEVVLEEIGKLKQYSELKSDK